MKNLCLAAHITETQQIPLSCALITELFQSRIKYLAFFELGAGVIAPVVLGIALIFVLPSLPFFVGELVLNLALIIENVWGLAKEKVAQTLEWIHASKISWAGD